jgi:hypothetical protein
MNIASFLERLANQAHFQPIINSLIESQTTTIKNAILSNDIEGFKKQISKIEFFANETRVVSI